MHRLGFRVIDSGLRVLGGERVLGGGGVLRVFAGFTASGITGSGFEKRTPK